MNILKQEIAPLTQEAWKEIKEVADNIFNIYLTARKFVDINGPNGIDFGGLSTGRLILPKNPSKSGINYGLREIIPLIEIRKPFELDIWELDNISRGAKDINIKPLEEAAREFALFEENAIYNGFKNGQIKGLAQNSPVPVIIKNKDPYELLRVISEQVIYLKQRGVSGPYTLILDNKCWQKLASEHDKGYPVIKQLKETIEGQVILNHSNKDSFIVSERGGDFELTLGQDIAIGYDSHNNQKVKLFLTESFTFRVINPEAISMISNIE